MPLVKKSSDAKATGDEQCECEEYPQKSRCVMCVKPCLKPHTNGQKEIKIQSRKAEDADLDPPPTHSVSLAKLLLCDHA